MTTTAEWLAAHPAGLRPELVADATREAKIVGLGASIREAHEPFDFVMESTRLLIDQGFTTLALLENPRVTDLYDRFLCGEDVDIEDAVKQAWGPWQTAEMRDALIQFREYNRATSAEPIRIVGISGSAIVSADYDRIVDLLLGLDPSAAEEVKQVLDTIRVAHDSGEHVLHADGTHPGTAFVELARTARHRTARLKPGVERDAALALLDEAVEFHANAPGAAYDSDANERAAATRLLDHHRRTGDRIVFWEGSAHIAAHSGGPMIGSHLRAELGDDYLAVHVTVGGGRISRFAIPGPQGDSIDAQFAATGQARTVDLRTAALEDFSRPTSTRLISGLYTPEADADHYYELPSVTMSFDLLVYIPEVTPIRQLDDRTIRQ